VKGFDEHDGQSNRAGRAPEPGFKFSNPVL